MGLLVLAIGWLGYSFVKIRIQHAPIIANAVFLIIVVTLALYTNVHQAEALGEYVRILSLFQ